MYREGISRKAATIEKKGVHWHSRRRQQSEIHYCLLWDSFSTNALRKKGTKDIYEVVLKGKKRNECRYREQREIHY